MITAPLPYREVSTSFQHAVHSIIGGENEQKENTCTIYTLLESLATMSTNSVPVPIGSKSSHLYTYSIALQTAVVANWNATTSLVVVGEFLEMTYEWGINHASVQKPVKRSRHKALEDIDCTSSVTSPIDGRLLSEQAAIFAKKSEARVKQLSNAEKLSFLLEKLSDEWIDHAYCNIKQSLDAGMLSSMSPLISVIFRNKISLSEEVEYYAPAQWSVDMVLSVFTAQQDGSSTFRFLFPSSSWTYSSDDATTGSMTLVSLSKGKIGIVIYYMYT